MANLQIKGINDNLHAQIKALAAAENRSVSQQLLHLIKAYLNSPSRVQQLRSPAQALLDLSGGWEDERDSEEIIREIKKGRKNSKKLSTGL